MIELITTIISAIASELPNVIAAFGAVSTAEQLAALDQAIADMVAAKDAGLAALKKIAGDSDAVLDAEEQRRKGKP